MPHVHLGVLRRRAQDHQKARREIDEAMILLQREDPSRLLLFGGGFSREALVALCQAELNGNGAPA
jgi:chemotaxis protein methyltransferase CheR